MKPREVAEKPLKRWYREAFKLLNQNKRLWVFFAITFITISTLLGASPYLTDVATYGFICTGVGLAKYLDSTKHVRFGQAVHAFLLNLPKGLLFSAIAVSVITPLIMIFKLTFHGTDNALAYLYNAAYTLPTYEETVFKTLQQAAWRICDSTLTLYFIDFFFFISPLTYITYFVYDLTKNQIHILMSDFVQTSSMSSWNQLIQSHLLLCLVLTIVLPIFTLLLMTPIICTTIWIAWKDIFEHEDGVTEKAAATNNTQQTVPQV